MIKIMVGARFHSLIIKKYLVLLEIIHIKFIIIE